MKQLTLSLAIVLMAAGAMMAQTSLFGMQVKKWGLSAGVERDMINNMDYDYLSSISRNSESLQAFSSNAFPDERVYETGVCENPHLRLDVVLAPRYMRNTELHISAVGIINRVDGMSYSYFNYNQNQQEYLNIYGYGNELGIETALVKSFSLGPLRFYGGAGGNLGYSFGNEVSVSGSGNTVEDISMLSVGYSNAMNNLDAWTDAPENTYIHENYSGKVGFHQRAFLKAGFGISFFKRVELGFDVRRGVGLRQHIGAAVKGTNFTSYALTAKYVLPNRSCCDVPCCAPKPGLED